MKREQDAADVAVAPALLFWSRLIQAAAAVVIILSLTLLLAPRLGEAIFNLVYFHQPSIPVEVPNLAMGYIWFANGIIGAVMAGWIESERALEVALQLFRKGSADFADCLHVALATQAGEQPLWTFDRGAAKVSGAQLLAKA